MTKCLKCDFKIFQKLFILETIANNSKLLNRFMMIFTHRLSDLLGVQHVVYLKVN